MHTILSYRVLHTLLLLLGLGLGSVLGLRLGFGFGTGNLNHLIGGAAGNRRFTSITEQ